MRIKGERGGGNIYWLGKRKNRKDKKGQEREKKKKKGNQRTKKK